MTLYDLFRKVFINEIAQECSFWYEQGRKDEAKYGAACTGNCERCPYVIFKPFKDPRNYIGQGEVALDKKVERTSSSDDSPPPSTGGNAPA